MAISVGTKSVSLGDVLSKTTELDILNYYFHVNELPVVIHSPLRHDVKPSFGLYTLNGSKVYYVDLSTRDRGGLFDLLMKYWGESYSSVLNRVWEDLPNIQSANVKVNQVNSERTICNFKQRDIDLQCKVREWRDYDLEYWKSYGISLEWLKYADIYPISHKIVVKNGNRYVFGADKYAYAYVERKEGKVTLKIYQPFNKNGYKWSNRHDRSVISLWTKVPEYGDRICICSSMKDALCLWANTGIPALSIQGEGYSMSNTAISELKRRYKEIYIALDGDKAGIEDSKKLQEETGFKIIDCPLIDKAKDWSDIYHYYGKEVLSREFNKAIKETH